MPGLQAQDATSWSFLSADYRNDECRSPALPPTLRSRYPEVASSMPQYSAGLSRFVLVLPVVVSFAAGASVSAQLANRDAVPLSVATPGPLKPGGVTLIVVSATQDLTELTGEIAGRPVRFWSGASPRVWSGLAAVGLESAPGSVTLTIGGTTASGGTATP